MSLIRVGTSGYTYPWNKGRSSPFKWYLDQASSVVQSSGGRFNIRSEYNPTTRSHK